jgi:hypothetical protein
MCSVISLSLAHRGVYPELGGRRKGVLRAVGPRRRRRWRYNRRCNRRFGDETAGFGDVTAATSGTSRGIRERSERPQFEAIVQLAAGGNFSGSHDFQAKFTAKTINPRQTITTTEGGQLRLDPS